MVFIYVDDIVLGGNDHVCEFATQMQTEFEISMIGELSIFLGLQVSQLEVCIFLSQTKYTKEMLEKF